MPDDTVETTAATPEETPRPHNPAPDDEPIPEEDEEEEEEADKPLPFDAEPVAVVEVQPKLGLRDYVSLSGISQVQSSMLQTFMSMYAGKDHWAYYEKAEWDAFMAQAKAYTPRV